MENEELLKVTGIQVGCTIKVSKTANIAETMRDTGVVTSDH